MPPGLNGYIASCLSSFVILMAVATMHLLAWFDIAVDKFGLYRHREDTHWREKQLWLPLLFPSWIFIMWILMYVWQGLWILFGLQLIILEERSGWLYNKPSLTPPSTYITSSLGLAALLGWLVLFDNALYSNYAPLCMLVCCAATFFALARSFIKAIRYAYVLKIQYNTEIILSRILVHNGLAFLATWSVVILLYNVSYLLCVGRYLTPIYSGFVFLGIVLAYEIILFTADLFLAQHITVGLLSPYIVTLITFTQAVIQNYPDLSRMFMISLVMLGFSILLLLTKIVVDFQRIRFKGY